MITKEEYNYWKPKIAEYERLSSVSGSSTCTFCGGTKTTPFLGSGKSQDCKECDKNGKIKNSRLKELELDDMIELEQKFRVDVYMVCNHTDNVLPMKKNVLVKVYHVNGKKMGCLNKIHAKLDEMFYTEDVRPNGFEWVDSCEQNK